MKVNTQYSKLTVITLSALAFASVACSNQEEPKTPAEQAADDAVEETNEAVEEAGDAVEEAGDEAEDAAD